MLRTWLPCITLLVLVSLVVGNSGEATPLQAQAAITLGNATNLARAMDISDAVLVSATTGESDPNALGVGTVESGRFFPTEGSTFAILSTGNVVDAVLPNTSGGLSTKLDGSDTNAGEDLVQLSLVLDAPSNENCLSFDYAFFSEEFPEFIGSRFNDTFVAQSGEANITVDDQGTVIAPGNFALDDSGQLISINTSFGLVSGNTRSTYDAGTPLLRSQVKVDPSQPISVTLSIFDISDSIYDSAVFLDNVSLVNDPNCVTNSSIIELPPLDTPTDFAQLCQFRGGWYGEYSGTQNPTAFDEPTIPILREVSEPWGGRLRSNALFGLWGSGYFWSGRFGTDTAFLEQNPVYYTCDDELNYNWRTFINPTDIFDDAYAAIGEPADPTIYDQNNRDTATAAYRPYLGTDHWAARWQKTHTFDPDGDGSNGCLTTTVAGPGGGGVRRVCIPGLHLFRMSVNDGGRWFINNSVPDTHHGWGADRIVTFFLTDGEFDLFWYDAFQDRKEVVDIGYALFSEQYASDLGLSRVLPFDAQIDVQYYEKDGRASVAFFIDPFTDATRSRLLRPYSVANVANAAVQGDVWDKVVIPEEMITLPPLDASDVPQPEVPRHDPTQPDVVALTPDEIVVTVYLPAIGR